MELEIELNDYSNIEKREYGASLVFDAYLEDTSHSGHYFGKPYHQTSSQLIIEGAVLFTYDQDGGSLNEHELDESEVLALVDEEEIMEKLLNNN